MTQDIMISGFDKSTIMAQPWAEAGYLCYCIDIQHPKGETREGNIIKVGADLMRWIPPRGNIIFASFFTPCTDVAVSGARHFKNKGLWALYDAIGLFAASVNIAESLKCPWFLENPVSTLSSYWRKSDYTFDPCDYGDPYTKKTCLWTGGGFVMPEKTPVEPVQVCSQGSWVQKLGGKSQRTKDLRSATPRGFAKAVFEANNTLFPAA